MYIDKDRNIQTTAYHKETDCERYLHSKFEHPLCLKESVLFSQALRLQRTCSTITAFEDESTEFIKKNWGDDIKLMTYKKKLNTQVIAQEKSYFKKPKIIAMSPVYL